MLFIVVAERSSRYAFGELAARIDGEGTEEPLEELFGTFGEILFSQHAENRFWACLVKIGKKNLRKVMVPEIKLGRLTYNIKIFMDARKLKIYTEALEKKFLYFDASEDTGKQILGVLQNRLGKFEWKCTKTFAYLPKQTHEKTDEPLRFLVECGTSKRLFPQNVIHELNYHLQNMGIVLKRPRMFHQLNEQLAFWNSPNALKNQYFKPTSRAYYLLRNPETQNLRMRLKTNYRYVRNLKHTNSVVSSDSLGQLALRETQSDE